MSTAPTVSVDSNVQAMRNLALLARQAISNGFPTMTCDPKMIADACLAYEAVGAVVKDEDRDTMSRRLEAAEANVASLTRQVALRYQDGLREGTAAFVRQADELAFAAAKIAKDRPHLNGTEAVAAAKALMGQKPAPTVEASNYPPVVAENTATDLRG